MKRKKLTWLFCLFFAAFFFLVPAVAHASAKDDIGKYDVTVNILKNGDAKVTHEITYNLSKKAHQLTLPQSISGIDDVYAVSVSVVSGSKKIRLKQGTSHKKNTFETKQTNKNSEITTYGNYGTDPLKFTYVYKLRGFVTNYKDCAEVNWRVISNNLTVPQRNVGIHFV